MVTLEVYDAGLLYNSARLPAAVVVSATALLVLGASSRRPSRPGAYPRPSVVVTIREAYACLVILFVIPALPIRYALNFDGRTVALAVSVALLATAAAYALTHARPRMVPVAVGGALATLAALLGVAVFRPAVAHLHGYSEVRLASECAIGLVVLVAVSTAYDRWRFKAG